MAFLRKHGNIYYIVDYNKATKKQPEYSLKTSDKKYAETLLKRFNAKRLLNQLPEFLRNKPNPAKSSLREALNKFLEEKKTPATIQIYKIAVESFINICGEKPIDQITPNDYDIYKIWFRDNKCKKTKKNYSIETVATYSNHIHLFFDWLKRNDYIKENYFPRSKKSKGNPRPIPKSVLDAILNELKDKPKLYNFVKITYLCAFRKGETIACEVEDFDLKEKIVYVRNKKGKRIDMIPMLDDIESFLYEIKLPATGRLFNYASVDGAKTFWNTLRKKLSFNYRFHDLRSARITDLANLGVEPLFLQKFARHKDINITLSFYTKINIKKQREAMNITLRTENSSLVFP